MGQDNGKNASVKRDDYFQQQLRLYRWRADPASNTHISRVYFTSKNRLMGRNKLHDFLHRQLQQQNYVDVEGMSCFARDEIWQQGEQVMTFQNYCATLDMLQGELNLQQMLYVLQVLLCGFESIFQRFGKLCISSENCFITDKGELRAWINSNPALNQFADDSVFAGSQTNAINQILRVCGALIEERIYFLEFYHELKAYLDKDILHNTGFSPVRRFVNGYVYSHRLTLPQDLASAFKIIKQKQKEVETHNIRMRPRQRQSSLSELIEPEPDSASNLRFMSTKANLVNPRGSVISESSSSSEYSNSHKSDSRLEFYRPEQKHQKKLSNLDVNSAAWPKRSLNRSQVSKKSGNISASSAFSKKSKAEYADSYQLTTPKNVCRTRTGLQSTSAESFLCHSKDPSGLAASKIVQSSSATNFFDNRQMNHNFQKKNVVFYQLPQEARQSRFKKAETQQNHSKQPSFDENSSSLFVSPANQMVHFEANMNYKQPDLSKIEAVSESSRSEQSRSSEHASLPSVSTRGQMTPSQLLTRQVSGLVQNQDIHLLESCGSFLSIDNNSVSSEYKGVLLGLCRSAKMLMFPTRRMIEHRNSRRQSRYG